MITNKESNQLWSNDYYPLWYLNPTKTGAVILKCIIKIDKKFNNSAFEKVDFTFRILLQKQYETIIVGKFRKRA